MIDPDFPWLEENDYFPFPEPDEEGIVASGGNLSPGLLLSAYRQGVFPWFGNDKDPILWWSLDPRFVILPETLHIPRSLEKELRNRPFRITVDKAFNDVIKGCSRIKRKKQRGTWITPEMISAYEELHRLGYAHSVEAWRNGVLAGGLYGLSIGSCFFGESMFSSESGASRQAFAVFARALFRKGCTLIDCQQETPHLATFGAVAIPRSDFISRLESAMNHPTRKGSWDPFFPEAV